ncbi:hypothetical protein TNIN_31521 [Trichonephila inaurata madagascariensis]|uniref:Uncharacterized protein n=1 Tax=Trichonephila inaurata madagascariensis TaxID=2747483 RepID=A0A8X7BUY3_9ARAC|nr:hypothetical protein TNIN_31521 [Trichonephila inaurata madagascariensis]
MSSVRETVLRQGYVQWPGAEHCPASGVCPLSERQKSVHREGYVQCHSSRVLSIVRGITSVRGGRTVSCVKGMSSVQVTELCPLSDWQNIHR